MMPGRRPEKLLARAVEPPATTGPTTATGSFCKAGDPSNPVLTVTTRLAGITETPVAATASPLPTGAATRTVFDPDWGEVGEKTGSTFTGSTVVAPKGEPLVTLEETELTSPPKLRALLWP